MNHAVAGTQLQPMMLLALVLLRYEATTYFR
jgi:hypothetical protein